jgi:hypothetical protein
LEGDFAATFQHPGEHESPPQNHHQGGCILMKAHLFRTTVLSSLFLMPVTVLAAVGSTIVERSPNLMRHQAEPHRNAFQGSLTCITGEKNGDQPCALRFTDNENGRVYGVVENNHEVTRLYQSGTKNVAIEGQTDGGKTLIVHSVRSL